MQHAFNDKPQVSLIAEGDKRVLEKDGMCLDLRGIEARVNNNRQPQLTWPALVQHIKRSLSGSTTSWNGLVKRLGTRLTGRYDERAMASIAGGATREGVARALIGYLDLNAQCPALAELLVQAEQHSLAENRRRAAVKKVGDDLFGDDADEPKHSRDHRLTPKEEESIILGRQMADADEVVNLRRGTDDTARYAREAAERINKRVASTRPHESHVERYDAMAAAIAVARGRV